jgi:DNA integrity scanning protein DisA with diadenylate cyclase activity
MSKRRESIFDLAGAVEECISREGHDSGNRVGTTFVIGDSERVLGFSRQMVLNPFMGYSDEERNILDPALEATVKEFAAIDGAFVTHGDGQIEAAGVYLKPGVAGEILPRGLGTRHESAAGITATTDAVAITVSESTGTVTVFRGGKILIELERPRPIGPVGIPQPKRHAWRKAGSSLRIAVRSRRAVVVFSGWPVSNPRTRRRGKSSCPSTPRS